MFSPGAIAEMQNVFYLYTDLRDKKIDIRDIILTASSLGLDEKFNMAYHLLERVAESTDGNALDFETFVRELTNQVVRVHKDRETHSAIRAGEGRSTCWITTTAAS